MITTASTSLVPIALTSARLLLAPALIGAASLVIRYRGPTVGGWLASLPLTSGPVVLLLALEHGPRFAAEACIGILLALPSLAAFALAYAWSAQRLRWPFSVALGCAAYSICIIVISRAFASAASIATGFGGACIVLVLALRIMPTARVRDAAPAVSGGGILLRMTLTFLLVWMITRFANLLGPRASGLLTPFPVVASLLAAFTHRAGGAAAVTSLLRGLLAGLFSFATFFLVAGVALQPLGIAAAFGVAAAAALLTHAANALLWRARRSGQVAGSVTRLIHSR